MAPLSFGSIYVVFAAGYFLSYAFRVVNAVMAPDLTRDLALHPSSLGLLTSTYLLAFGLLQLPAGILLDRYGPRRVEPVLLSIAGVGAIAFGLAESLGGLVIARALIGAGVCVCLMAPLKALAMWYPSERQAPLAGWIMVAGSLGALLATTPLEFALRVATWRTIFVVLGAVTIVVAAAIAWRVPDMPRPAHPPSLGSQWAGVMQVVRHPRFWWLAPVGAAGMGSFMAIQGLWAVPWMMDVDGMTRAGAADRLFALGVVVLAGYVALGTFSARLTRRGVTPAHLYGAGFGVHTLALAAIVARVPGSYLWWSLYGLGAAVNILAFTVLGQGFAKELAARANTTLNLMMFGTSFVAQWGIGIVAEGARAAQAPSASGLRTAFVVVLALDVAGMLWFARGWRRQMGPPPAPLQA
ncbi:MAG: MFS transporter [Casimicrobiaceae bacterium]